MSQTGRVGQLLATSFLRLEPGDQVPTIAELAAAFEVGTGTVQKALDLLKDAGGVELQPRGHLGTFIRSVDRTALWKAAGADIVVGSMPLPYSRRYEALATGLRAAWPTDELELLLSFARGSEQRLQALTSNRVDFAVMSRFAADNALERGLPIEVAVQLPGHSYVQGHELLFAPGKGPEIKRGYRVGVDSTSADQVALTKLECADRAVEMIEISYMQLAEALTTNRIDAAVWSSDQLVMPMPEVSRTELHNNESRQLAGTVTTAVIVTSAEGAPARELIRSLLDVGLLEETLSRVLSGDELPSY